MINIKLVYNSRNDFSLIILESGEKTLIDSS